MINKYTNKQRGLLAVIMAMVMVFAGAAFVAAEVDATNGVAVDEGDVNLDIEYSAELNNTEFKNVISYNEDTNKITGGLTKLAGETLNAVKSTWSTMPDSYTHALVMTVGVPVGSFVSFVGSDNSVKSIKCDDGVLTLLKYISEENKNTPFTYYLSNNKIDDVNGFDGLVGNSIEIDVELVEPVDTLPSKLSSSVFLKNTITLSGDYTVDLNGYTIYSQSRVFEYEANTVDKPAFTINANGGSIVAPTIFSSNYIDMEVNINGGTYVATSNGWTAAFIMYAQSNGGAITVTGADITSNSNAIWISNKPWSDVKIIDCSVVADYLALYLGTDAKAEITNSDFVGNGVELDGESFSTVEVKAGNVKFNGGTITGTGFILDDVNNNGPGSMIAPLAISNAYEYIVDDTTVSVDITDTVIYNLADNNENDLVAIVGSNKLNTINVSTDSQTIDQIKVQKYDLETVNIKTTQTGDASIITEIAGTIEKDTVFIPEEDGSEETEINVGNDVLFTIISDAGYTAKINLGSGDDKSTFLIVDLFGSFTFKKGSIITQGQIDSGTIVTNGEELVFADGVIINNLIIADGTPDSPVNVKILEGSTVTILGELFLGEYVKMSNDGELVGGGVIDVPAESQFYTSTPVSVGFSGDGQIILEDAMETLRISDKLASSLITEPTQKVIITDNLTIKSGQYLVIQGDLEIPEGVTVTIEKGGRLTLDGPTAFANIYGTIKSEGMFNVTNTVTEDVNIFGSVIASKYSDTQAVATVNISGNTNVEGTIIINAKAVAMFGGKVTVAETGTVDVRGTMKGDIINKGTVTINGSVDGMTINVGAVTSIVNIDALKGGILEVADLGMKLSSTKKVTENDDNSMEFSNVKGIKVTEAIKYNTATNGDRIPYSVMYIDGTATIADAKAAEAGYEPGIKVTDGTATIDGEVTLSKVPMTIVAAVIVNGTVYADEGMIIGAGEITVLGLIRVADSEMNVEKINAVMYDQKVNDQLYYFYTNLADAIASGETDLTVLGDLYVLADTTIPAGVSIDADNSNVYVGSSTMEITNVTLTVADGGFLDAKAITVDGTFIIENTDTGIDCNSIVSDTSVLGESDAMYTNIYNALSKAESGDKVSITKKGDGKVYLDRDVAIAEGVTLEIKSGKTLMVKEGVTLAIIGILENKGTIDAYALDASGTKIDGDFGVEPVKKTAGSPDEYYAVISVSGSIVSNTDMPYTEYKIAGAYYEAKGKYYITTVEKSAEVITTVDGAEIDIYGKNTVGTVAFVGTESIEIKVDIDASAELYVESMTITNGSINMAIGSIISGSFGNENGSINMKNIKVSVPTVLVDEPLVTDDSTVQMLYVTGTVAADKSDVKPVVEIDGTVTIDGLFKFVGKYTTTRANYSPIAINESAEVLVNSNGAIIEADKQITVNGSLISYNNGSVSVNTLVVAGSLEVREVDDDGTPAGKINVTHLYVGGTTSDVSTFSKIETINTAGSATVNSIYFNTIVYLFPGSTVVGDLSDAMTDDDVKYTEFYVEDVLWLTVYNFNSTDVMIAYDQTNQNKTTDTSDDTVSKVWCFVPKTLEDCEFESWQYSSSGKMYDVASGKKIGDYSKVYASINYDIYTVVVITSEGIDDVYIDGKLVPYINVGNGASGYGVMIASGSHTISYTLANGYTGQAKMLVDGKEISGYTFTVGGDVMTYQITLQGIEKIPAEVGGSTDGSGPTVIIQPADDKEMSLTDILLIVLVVLIVIMAIIVALRMMRS